MMGLNFIFSKPASYNKVVKENSTNFLTLSILPYIKLFAILFFTVCSFKLTAQVPPPPPCTNGTQETCKCNTSPILCTIDDLDGYTYSMSHFLHPNDGPHGTVFPQGSCMCPGQCGTTSHNPTWFRFPAWCEELTLEVCWSNCTQNPGQCNSRGIQSAVYSECFGCPPPACFGSSWHQSANPSYMDHAIGCDVDGCGPTSGCAILNMTGLELGKIYYFLVDGCCGSACDVEIEVVGGCGDPEIQDWTGDVEGPDYICAGGDPVTYSINARPQGANRLGWFVDGVLITEGASGAFRNFTYQFVNPGTYEVCVDARQDPCLDYDSDPPPNCITVEVYEVEPIDPDPGYVCPGETFEYDGDQYNPGTYEINYTTEGGCDSTIFLEVIEVPIIETDLGIFEICDGESVEIGDDFYDTSGNYTVTLQQAEPPNCDSIVIFEIIVYSANAGNLAITPNPLCPGDTATITVTGFNNDPDNEQYILIVDDAGSIIDVISGSSTTFTYEECGEFTIYSYNFHPNGNAIPPVIGMDISDIECEDGCCDLISDVLIFEDTEAPVLLNPPANLDLVCHNLLAPMVNLNYTDNCLPNGSVPGEETGMADLCDGGTLTRTWIVEDDCGNTVEHVQTINIQPLVAPTFTNPPPNITISCSTMLPPASNLTYTNGLSGACAITGNVPAVIDGSAGLCGSTVTYTWSYTDVCDRTISHVRTITIDPSPEPWFLNPPADITVFCDNIPQGSPAQLNYTNGVTGSCQILGSVPAVVTGAADLCGGIITYTWTFVDPCDRVLEHIQTITVEPVPEAAFVNPPASATIDCDAIPAGITILEVTNGWDGDCEIADMIVPEVDGAADLCGGVITYTWTHTDVCNRTISHQQVLTATPVPQAEFVNPPVNETVDCDGIPAGAPELELTNGLSGDCLISEMVIPTVDGAADLCGGTITYTWTHTDVCDRTTSHTRTVTATPVPQAEFVDPPSSETVDCDAIPAGAPDLLITNNLSGACLIEETIVASVAGAADLCGGTITYTWTHTDVCDRISTHVQTITANPVPQAEFVDAPLSETVDCDAIPSGAPDLLITNNLSGACLIEETIVASVAGAADLCGGTITYTWNHTDVCDRISTHVQTITANPVPQAEFVDAPPSGTVDCDAIPAGAPDLLITNNLSGACLIEETIIATVAGAADLCGGTITYTWNHTDVCDRTSTHVQTIIANPVPQAEFVDPPPSETVDCDAIPSGAPDLLITNNLSGACLIEETIVASVAGAADLCGGTITYTWNHTDVCNRTSTHVQTIVANPVPQAEYVDPPPSETVDCDAIPAGANDLVITNNLIGACLIEETIVPIVDGAADLCGGTITYTWNHTDVCDRTTTHVQTIIANPVPQAEFVDPPPSETVDCDAIPAGAPELVITNNLIGACLIEETIVPIVDGAADLCGGTITYTWNHTDVCDRTSTHVQTIIANPVPQAEFVDPPPSETVDCDAIPAGANDLVITNNLIGACLIEETIIPIVDGAADLCGGTITYTWNHTDVCDRTSTHIQTIIANPVPQAEFVDPPPSETVDCDAIPAGAPDLVITNNLIGACLIEETIIPIVDGAADLCGGTITYTWNHTDVCDRTSTHVQTIIANPVPQAEFVDPPPSETVDCDAIPAGAPDLVITNNLIGACLIEETIIPIVDGAADLCGGTITYTWNHTDVCDRTSTHVQTIIANPVPQAEFVDLPPSETVDCDAIPSGAPDLMITNNLIGACLIEETIVPIVDGAADLCGGTITYTWNHTDVCNRTSTHVQTIIANPVPQAEFVDPPPSETVDCDAIPTGNAADLVITNGLSGDCLIESIITPVVDGFANLCGGTITYTWTHTDVCNRTSSHVQTIQTNPVPQAAFVDPPPSETVDCDAIPAGAPDLVITNNLSGDCLIEETIIPTVVGAANLCGGTITYTWNHTDVCNRSSTHVQTIIANPVPQAEFVNPPPSETVDCDAIPAGAPELLLTNGLSGDCLIESNVTAIENGFANLCGGTINYTWTYTDVCDRTTSHVQTIVATPVPQGQFIGTPFDLVIECGDDPGIPPALQLTNGLSGACLIEELVPVSSNNNSGICGGQIVNTWSYVDVCGRPTSHTQTINVNPTPIPTFNDYPPDLTIECTDIPSTYPTLIFDNGMNGACRIAGQVLPIVSGNAGVCGGFVTNTWTFTDNCGRTINHSRSVTVLPSPAATFDNPPADIILECHESVSAPQALAYSNGLSGECEIQGEVFPNVIGDPDLCGGQIAYIWQFTDPCGRNINHTQIISINPTAAAEFTNPPSDIILSCEDGDLWPQPLLYTNGESAPQCRIEGQVDGVRTGSYSYCGGVLYFDWNFTDECGRSISHEQLVLVEEASQAQFIDAPQDITISCYDYPIGQSPLYYSNGGNGTCSIDGFVMSVESGSFDGCGGTLFHTWTFTDDCGRTIEHIQTIVVEPEGEPYFENGPIDMTVTCDEVAGLQLNQPLQYTNGEFGLCEVYGTIFPLVINVANECGGEIQVLWFETVCDFYIEHLQIITVEPAAAPTFINAPADLVLDCGLDFPPSADLSYDNGESGNCARNGTVSPQVSTTGDIQTRTWSITDNCGQTLSHTQIITRRRIPDMQVTPGTISLCEGASYDLSNLNITDQNNTNPVITFHSGTPANSGNELSSTLVQPIITTTYYIYGINAAGCFDEIAFTITVDTTVYAGTNNQATLCYGSNGVNFWTYLGSNYNNGGSWVDVNNSGADISNPGNVNFSGIQDGQYTYRYIVSANGACPGDTAELVINLIEEVQIVIDSIRCNENQETYNVFIQSNGHTITTNVGNIVSLGNDRYHIADIDTSEILIITAVDPNSGCENTFVVNPPNCDCPDVSAPVNLGNPTICEGDPIPLLAVTVQSGAIANWYDAPSGGTLLLGNSLTYNPNVSAPGIYRFYVEAQDVVFPECKSSIRTTVTLEIIARPIANNALLEACDDAESGFAPFDLNLARTQINPNQNLTFSYHLTRADAENGSNPLVSPYTNVVTPTQVIFVTVSNTRGCKSIAELTLTVLPAIQISVATTRVSCPGDMNGSVTVTVSGGVGQKEYSIDNVSWSNNNVFSNLGPGSYTVYVRDSKGCRRSLPFTIQPGLLLNLEAFEIICDNNGTASDPSDDFYTIRFNITHNYGNTGTYRVTIGGNPYGPYNYNQINSIVLPADGNNYVLSFTDVINQCSISQSTGDLTPCSTDCLITVEELSKICDDNGTPSDPSDDFYTVTVNASAVNQGASNSFIVVVNGNTFGPFIYGVGGTFIILADGTNPTITYRDADINDCSTSQPLGILNTCSDLCVISIALDGTLCDNNGTESDGSDDLFTYFVTVTGLNTANSWYVQGFPGNTYPYNQSIELGPYLIANGPVTFIVVDSNDPNCTATITITPPEPCSTDCLITVTQLEKECDDAGTPSDPLDDLYIVRVNATAINQGGANRFIVTVNGVNYGPYFYGIGGTFIIPADGSNPQIRFQDSEIVECVAVLNLGDLTTCSDLCVISAILNGVECDNNGTESDPDDDIFTYFITVNGLNTASTWYLQGNPGTTYSYNQSVELGPSIISNGTITIIVVDSDDPNCTAQLVIDPPSPCSTDCLITVTQLEKECDDAGTPSDPSDDFYTVTVNATVVNQGIDNSFIVIVNGITYGPFDYGVGGSFEIPADGTSPNIRFIDTNIPECIVNNNLGSLITCSDLCVISIVLDNIECDNNGTESDAEDDLFTYFITVSGLNTATTWYIQGAPGTTYPYNQSFEFGPELIIDGAITIIVVDSDDPNCTAQLIIDPPSPCSTDCLITVEELSKICNDSGTPSDPSDDFYTVNVNATAVNQGIDNSFIVIVNGITYGPFDYGVGGSFVVPADGTSPNIRFIDTNIPECIINRNLGALITCSDLCVISVELNEVLCDDNGTTTDASDDLFTYTITLTGLNTASSWYIQGNPGMTYPYGQAIQLGPSLISGGAVTVIIVDSDDPNCTATLTVDPPAPCSTDCLITITDLEILCNDAGTPSDPLDDYYTIRVNATAVNQGIGNTFNIIINGITYGPYFYGTGGQITIPADGTSPTIRFEDSEVINCFLNRPLGELSTCSGLCILNGVIGSIECNNQGTTNDLLDDTWTYSITVSGLNTGSGCYIETDPGNVYSYGTAINFGPLLISSGSINLVIIDQADPDCRIELMANPPPPCSDPCTIDIQGLIIGLCDDNNTGPIEDDDFFNLEFRVVQLSGVVTQYRIIWNGQIFGPYNYDELIIFSNLPADGETHVLVFEDINNSECRIVIDVSRDPCSSCDQIVSAGPDFMITCAEPEFNIMASSSEPGNYSWIGPEGFVSTLLNPTVDVGGWYYLTVTFDDQCEFQDSLFISVSDDVPIADAGQDKILNCLIFSVTLGGTGTSAGDNLIYIWTDLNGNIIGNNITLIVDQPGEYFLQVRDTLFGCNSPRDRVVVTLNRDLPSAAIYANPGELLNCVVLSIILSSDAQSNTVLTWTFEGNIFNQNELIIDRAGTVFLTVTDTLNGCTASNSITIQDLVEYPIIAIDPPGVLDCIDTLVTIDASKSQGDDFITFEWYDENGNLIESGTKILLVNSPGIYILILQDTTNGCTNRDTVVITSNAIYPDVTAGPDVDISCLEFDALLQGSGQNIGSDFIILWTTNTGNIVNGRNTFTPRVDGPGFYYLDVFNPSNGCRSIDSTFVRPNADGPAINALEIDSIYCFGANDGRIELLDIGNGTPPINIFLNGRPTDNTGIFSPLRPGRYTIRIVDARGCEADTVITLNEGRRISIDLIPQILVNLGDSAELVATVNIPEDEISTINWSPAQFFTCDTCLITTVIPINTQQYKIIVTDIHGCIAQEFIVILVKKDIKIFVPGAFTPNNDGNNDGFTIYTDENVKIIREARIFDRWGGLMYYRENFPPNDPTLGWDGTVDGQFANIGVYVYYFIVEMNDGTLEVLSGDVSLLKRSK